MVTLPDQIPPDTGSGDDFVGFSGAWAYVNATAPPYPGPGMLWFDTTEMVLKVFADGTWNLPMKIDWIIAELVEQN